MVTRRQARVLAWLGALILALALAIAASGCASDEPEVEQETAATTETAAPSVELQDLTTEVTDGKALHFTASTGAKLSGEGGRFAIELSGVYVNRGHHPMPGGVSDLPLLACVTQPCEWTLLPDDATTYEFQAFLVNLDTRKATAKSALVEAVWKAPPRPDAFKFLINGKNLPLVPLDGVDEYLDAPVGKLQAEARWTTDTKGTGYYVVVSTTVPEKRDHAKCTTGTSCLVPTKVPIKDGQEMTWEVTVMTTRGDKVATALRVCLVGRA
jgi:hypothetical protein